jgi:uncharacterized membrane protein YdjX (TVP38/TMEM64 family)
MSGASLPDASRSESPPVGRRGGPVLSRAITLGMLGALAIGLAVSPSARGFTVHAFRLLLNPDVAQGVRELRDFLAPYGDRAWIITSILMVLQSFAAPIPAVPITLTNALLYGPWLGTLISWGSAEVAAALCFLLARALGRPFVEKLFRPALLARLDGFFRSDGLVAVLVLRLVPYVSFDIVSYAGGLTSMRLLPFLVATGAGQLPATMVYSHAGSRLATEPAAALRFALIFLGVMAVVVVAIAWALRARRRAAAAREGAAP